ncbi:MAG TPA: hypothetical protein DEO50_00410 [Erysipelotrichaceae bacterium]|nr:hypothetical protein [Erysipelotrichaceae bacterium]
MMKTNPLIHGFFSMNPAIQILKQAVDEGKIPGAQLSVSHDGIIEEFNVGKANIFDETSLVNSQTLYDLASLTKVVSTTTLALIAIQEGRLHLEDPVDLHLSGFKHHEVTIKHLLTHTSGLCADDKKYRSVQNPKEMLEFILLKDLDFNPGTFVEYTDFGYILLGFILEKIYGNLEDAVTTKILLPLNMHDTCFNPLEKGLTSHCAPTEVTFDRGLIQGEVHDGKAYRMNGVSGNAGLFSNTTDLMKFAQCLLLGGAPILTPQTHGLLLSCCTDGLNLRRTLGWQFSDHGISHFGDHASDLTLFHTGFSGTSLCLDFRRQIAIVLLTNRVHPKRDNDTIKGIRNAVHDAVFEEFDHL